MYQHRPSCRLVSDSAGSTRVDPVTLGLLELGLDIGAPRRVSSRSSSSLPLRGVCARLSSLPASSICANTRSTPASAGMSAQGAAYVQKLQPLLQPHGAQVPGVTWPTHDGASDEKKKKKKKKKKTPFKKKQKQKKIKQKTKKKVAITLEYK
eukprot:NODE_20383_length_800_cov_11.830609.p2 GENE.NODE_20383_length_800_cov_11.830609~~NODE_20383_length_800_cov_11.830609.p2  ORF type:complete len:152 (+),score=45.35 NODE_20383_length_800_cov_11.830609:277-732(+)